MRKERIALHLVRNATSTINGVISPSCANLGIIVATSLENRSRAEETKRIKKTNEHSECTSSEDELFSHAAQHLSQAKKIREIGRDDGNYQTVAVRLRDVYVVMEADSGADVKIMDEHQFKAFIHRMNDKSTLTNSTVKLCKSSTQN